jgi:hypothetical protein
MERDFVPNGTHQIFFPGNFSRDCVTYVARWRRRRLASVDEVKNEEGNEARRFPQKHAGCLQERMLEWSLLSRTVHRLDLVRPPRRSKDIDHVNTASAKKLAIGKNKERNSLLCGKGVDGARDDHQNGNSYLPIRPTHVSTIDVVQVSKSQTKQ